MKNIENSVWNVVPIRMGKKNWLLSSLIIMSLLPSCVNVAAPDEPIVINLNIQIDQKITVEDAEAVDEAIEENLGIF